MLIAMVVPANLYVVAAAQRSATIVPELKLDCVYCNHVADLEPFFQHERTMHELHHKRYTRYTTHFSLILSHS